MTFRLSRSFLPVLLVSSVNILSPFALCSPDLEAFFLFSEFGFPLTFVLSFRVEFLLAFCDTLLEVAFFVLFLGRVRLSSFCVFSSDIARR